MTKIPAVEPFDVTTIDPPEVDEAAPVSSFIPRRSRDPHQAAIRGVDALRNLAANGAGVPDASEMGASPRAEDASEAKPAGVDFVNHPPHYTSHPSGVECITITEWYNFNVGNAIKYLWRAEEKGFQIQDLKKARWYVDREIARLEKLRDGKERIA